MRIVPSRLPLASEWTSGLKAASFTIPVWPLYSATSSPVSNFQIITTLPTADNAGTEPS